MPTKYPEMLPISFSPASLSRATPKFTKLCGLMVFPIGPPSPIPSFSNVSSNSLQACPMSAKELRRGKISSSYLLAKSSRVLQRFMTLDARQRCHLMATQCISVNAASRPTQSAAIAPASEKTNGGELMESTAWSNLLVDARWTKS